MNKTLNPAQWRTTAEKIPSALPDDRVMPSMSVGFAVAMIAVALLCGCVTGAKKQVLPPTVPGHPPSRAALPKPRVAAVRLPPPLPALTSHTGFAPASSAVPVPLPMEIYRYIPGSFIVLCFQPANSMLEMQWADSIGGPWNFLAGYGFTAEDQTVVTIIPDHWLPYNRMFVRSLPTATKSTEPRVLAAARPVSVDSGKRFVWRGRTWKLIHVSTHSGTFTTYKLGL